MSTQHVGIVGAGTMGNGIAQAFAVAGIPVTMTDIGEAQLAAVLHSLGWQARAGWRQVDDAGDLAWFVRFEQPANDAQS